MSQKFIFVVGGVMSGVGKGTACASIAKILQAKGFRVTALKIDPYINVDAGTMNPIEHGEVFVTDDGDETDQDIGTYERFLDQSIHSVNYMTTGRVYQTVIERERNLEYGGKCVEVVPHVPDEVIRRIRTAAKLAKADITLIEVGGTVGEYQNILFLEAARMMKLKAPKDVLTILVSYLPIPGKLGEMKTKPTQYASQTLNSAGIQADAIIARSEKTLDEPRRNKLALFCGVDARDIIAAPDVDSIYRIPLDFERQGFADRLLEKLSLHSRRRKDMKDWQQLVRVSTTSKKTVRIGIIGKYFSTGDFTLSDVYLSVIEATKHAAWFHKARPELVWLNSEAYERDPKLLKELDDLDGVIIPGGFGSRAVEGKIAAIQHIRTHGIPYLGICYGMQLAVVEYARHVLKLKDANTAEINESSTNPVIHIMPEQIKNLAGKKYGGTMRLGAYPCVLASGSRARDAYGTRTTSERHRHRYEVNNSYRARLEKNGLRIVGSSPDKRLVEIIELSDHPFFVAVQFHPEFKSRPTRPHPLFRDLLRTALERHSRHKKIMVS